MEIVLSNRSLSNLLSKVAINRTDPKESLVWIDAQWNKFECEFIPNENIDLKVAELNQEKEDRKSENIF